MTRSSASSDASTDLPDDVAQTAEEDLGIDRLRSGQREALAAALDGHDVLAVMPTGYGKSAIYQIAAAHIDGATLVVSPLIALQRDQVEALADADVGDAVEINSTIGERARADALERLRAGEIEFAFLAPEQLARDDTLEALRDVRPSLVVIDEAHCISSWGHDFRPDYLRLGEVIEELGHPTVLALTATAAPPVQAEIVARLRMRDPEIIVRGFDRPNIHLDVVAFPEVDAEEKDARTVARVVELAGEGDAGIVYVATRARTEELAAALVAEGIVAAAYHAGLPARRRDEVHEGFMDGEVRVVVATTAFGMGVDKPDVRFVVHGDVPDSLDSYSQEVGRGGRDGSPAHAVLFYRPEDLGLRRFLGGSVGVDPDGAVAVLERLGDGDVTVEELEESLDLPSRRLTALVARLVDLEVVERRGDVVSLVGKVDAEEIAAAVAEGNEQRRDLEATRLEMMRGYAESRGCRRRVLLTYFGEDHPGGCGNCDNCDSGVAADHDDSDDDRDAPFPSGTRVRHVEWGEGEVIRTEPDQLVVLFDTGGYRTLSAKLVVENDLLERC